MAVALDLTFTISDESGDPATTSLKIPNGFTLAQYGEFGAAMADLIDDFIGGRIDGVDLCAVADLSGLTLNLTSGADDVEDIGAFQFRSVDGRPVRLNVPGIDETLVAAGSDDLDQVDPAISAINTMMLNGIATTGGTIIPSDVGEDDLVSLDYARERFRASGSRR